MQIHDSLLISQTGLKQNNGLKTIGFIDLNDSTTVPTYINKEFTLAKIPKGKDQPSLAKGNRERSRSRLAKLKEDYNQANVDE